MMMRRFEMFSWIQLNGLIRQAESTGETRYLSEMKDERAYKIALEESEYIEFESLAE